MVLEPIHCPNCNSTKMVEVQQINSVIVVAIASVLVVDLF